METVKVIVDGFRPREIIEMAMRENQMIEETAMFLEPVYFWEVES